MIPGHRDCEHIDSVLASVAEFLHEQGVGDGAAAVDDARKELAEMEAVKGLLESEGLLREDDDEERIWYRPDASGVPQPEITEYGTTRDALRRVVDEARAEAAMAWDEDRKSHAVANQLGEALEMARGFLGLAVRSPRSAAWVADEALRAWRPRR